MKRKAQGPQRAHQHQADFKKIKRKVGKKAPLKANVTNTSFATKTIHVPAQKLHLDNVVVSQNAAAEASALTNARQLNLHDLFAQIKHYNSNVRRDALLGLKDLLTRHPGILVLESASLLQMTLPSILDEEKSVRGALLSLLGWMLPQLGAQGLQPFQGLFVSYVCSGLSHMHFAVRRSAMQALRIVMDLEKTGASNATPAAAAAAAASARLLWTNSFRQLLPNFLSCLSERVYVTKQNNIGSTEVLASASGGRSRGGSTSASALDSAAGSAATNIANRAMMLHCIEQYLALCPYLNQTGSSAHGSGSVTAAEDGEDFASQPVVRTLSLPPHVLHASSLHSLLYPDPSATGAASSAAFNSLDPWSSLGGAQLESAAGLVAGTRPVPQKYARKHAQQNKFFSLTSSAAAGTATAAPPQSEREKSQAVLSSFLKELLPLTIEYWLESFGLGLGGGAGGVGGAAAAAAAGGAGQGLKSRDHTDLLANLHSILRLIHSSLRILRAQRQERIHAALMESGVASAPLGDESLIVPESELMLPPAFSQSLRAHVFTSFPLGASELFPGMDRATTNDQQYRALNAINAECVAIMSCFMQPTTTTAAIAAPSDDTAAADGTQQQTTRRKSLSNRAAKQEADDAIWLHNILTYMSDSFHSLAESSAARAEAQQSHAKKEEGLEDAEMGDASVAVAPSTPARAASSTLHTPVAGRSGKKSRSAATRVVEHGSLADLLPLLQTLLPRLSLDKQEWMIVAFSDYYLSCHPLSPSKLACLRFLHDYLLLPPRGFEWMRVDALRSVWIDQGEWASLLMQLSDAVAHTATQLRAKQEEERANDASAPSAGPVSSPLLSRYCEMIDLLLNLLLRSARLFHGVVLDFQLIQMQLLPFWAHTAAAAPAATSSSSTTPAPVTPGPFWSLPPSLQLKSLHLLYYFDALSPHTLQLLLECLRNNLSEECAPLTLASKLMLIDMLEEKFAQARTNGGDSWPLQKYIGFVLGMLRSDVGSAVDGSISSDSIDASRVSDLLPAACRMLRNIHAEDIEAAVADSNTVAATRGPVLSEGVDASALLELMSPMLAQCLQAAVPAQPAAVSAAPAKLNLPTVLVLLDALLAHSGRGASLPAAISSILPSVLYFILSSVLTGSMVESGLVRVPAGWLQAPITSFLPDRMWLVAMRLLHAASTVDAQSPTGFLARLLQLMHTKLQENAGVTSGRDSALQVVVVLAALTKCGGIRELLPRQQAAVLSLAGTVQRMAGVASHTLQAALQAELTLLFGQQADMQM